MKTRTPDIPHSIDKLINKEVESTITEQEFTELVSWMYKEKKNWAYYTARKADLNERRSKDPKPEKRF